MILAFSPYSTGVACYKHRSTLKARRRAGLARNSARTEQVLKARGVAWVSRLRAPQIAQLAAAQGRRQRLAAWGGDHERGGHPHVHAPLPGDGCTSHARHRYCALAGEAGLGSREAVKAFYPFDIYCR